MIRKLLAFLLLLAGPALAQTNIGEVSIDQTGDHNNVDAVCTATNLDIRDLTSASDSVACVTDGISKDGTGDTTQANVSSGRLHVDGSGVTQPISAASLPLPTGAATSANQDGIVKDGTGDSTQANVSSGRLHVDGSGVTQPVSGTVTVGTFPDNEPVNVAQVGGTAVVAHPCEREINLYVQIDQTAGEQLITGTASERIYVCSISIITATAQNIALVDGTGSVCATSPTGLLGGSTAATGQNFGANGGWVLPFNPAGYAKTSTDADNVCLLQSASGQISGVITYVSVPNI